MKAIITAKFVTWKLDGHLVVTVLFVCLFIFQIGNTGKGVNLEWEE